MSTTERLFGPAGVALERIAQGVLADLHGATYRFMDPERFAQLPPGQMAAVYWTEILFRAHWAASTNLFRHQRWLAACLALCEPNPNYVGFTAALRGLVEAAADAFHSLRAVPLTLAEANGSIRAALVGTSSGMAISEELEDYLVHFQFARKLKKGEAAPDTHRAESATAYLASADSPDGKLAALYAELCQVVHPASASLLWTSIQDGEQVQISDGRDATRIQELCSRHSEAVQVSLMQSVNASLLILMVLNRFPVEVVHTPAADRWRMDGMPAWAKLEVAWLRGAK
jgi:hypothetical protein